jgi:hypothetical protein
VPPYISRGDTLSICEKIYNFWKLLSRSLSVQCLSAFLNSAFTCGHASALQRRIRITRRTRLMPSHGCER